jgi:SAM-dependent methyltransferase
LGEIFERVIPTTPLEWTGERLTTATTGQVEVEHLHRYFLARDLCRGLDVLDVAAGEGYGTALLAQVARSVVGVEISAEAVAHASGAYRGSNFRFLQGDARCLPLDHASVDAVVSFETIEHFYEHDQFLAEVRRVLRPGGRFIVSSPERDVYSPSGSNANPYHAHELSRAEFSALLCISFAHVRLMGHRPILGSALVSEGTGPGRTLVFEKRGPRHFEASAGLPRPVYFVAIASDQPVDDVPDSLYIDTAEIGAVLASACVAEAATAELSMLRAQVNAAETAKASALSELALSIQQANEQAASYRQQLLVADQASHDHAARASELEASLAKSRAHAAAAQADAESTRAEAAAACSQRDIARIAARRAAAASESHWHGKMLELGRRADEAEQQAAEWRRRASEAEQQVAEWRHQYEGLRERLEAFLRRFWIMRASRLIPAPGRRFLRQRLLGWGRQ